MICMGSTHRFRDNVVNQAQSLEILRSDFESACRGLSIFLTLPEYGRTTFGRDDRVIGILQHKDSVSNTDPQSTATAAFSGNRHDTGNSKTRHFTQVIGDSCSLASSYSANAWVSSGRINKSKNWPREFFGQLHEAQGFAIALRLGHSEVSIELLFCVTGLLCSHHNARLAVKGCET